MYCAVLSVVLWIFVSLRRAQLWIRVSSFDIQHNINVSIMFADVGLFRAQRDFCTTEGIEGSYSLCIE